MKRIAVAGVGARIHSIEAALGAGSRAADAGPAMASALEHAARERAQALDEARARGYAEGLARADHEIAQAAEAARAAVDAANAAEAARLRAAATEVEALARHLRTQAASMDAELEALAIEAVFAAALRVLATVPDAELVAGTCRAALDEYRQRPAVLRVAPADAPHVAFLGEEDPGALRIEADPVLGRGECRIQTHKAAYGTSLDARLGALKDAFLQARSAAREAGP